MKCQHTRVLYTEMTPHYKTHEFIDGKYSQSVEGEPGDISFTVMVECGDCGLKKDFNLTNKSCPSWVKTLHEQLMDSIGVDS